MIMTHSVEIRRQIEEAFRKTGVHRPRCVRRYEAGTELVYDVTSVAEARRGTVRLVIEDFIGGGFAGQVYRVRIIEARSDDGPLGGLEAGGVFAMKILVPPGGFSRFFRNALYWIGFQGPFQLQVNPAAARTGALWQKLIRRGAGIVFGDERSVVDIHATFVDANLGSCGELSEWVDGRTWHLEVDERVNLLRRWRRGASVGTAALGSPEYRAKYEFMHSFVKLLHRMGAHELARQYEWSTWKSQPNCLKRTGTEKNPAAGLVAVDFRAGLALLPFLPMSPGDFKLIAAGIARGTLVQFDRGDPAKLAGFIEEHRDAFPDGASLLEALRREEAAYRNSVPDVTHHRLRLLYSPALWSSISGSSVTGWKTARLLDDSVEEIFRRSRARTAAFWLLGCIPFAGTMFRRLWGRACWRQHYRAILSSGSYAGRAIRASLLERVIVWHRSGRINDAKALKAVRSTRWSVLHLPLSLLPAGLHRFLSEWEYTKDRLQYVFARPVRLYFNAGLREEWLREMVADGIEGHLLTTEDANAILSHLDEPFIQKYLKSLAVHICTLPVTQIVSFSIALAYVLMHPDMPRAQAYGVGLGIIALFQVIPVSPGSLARGLYVVYLVVRERNFRDYNIAVFLGFFKYIGYLAFPIQMTYRYTALARFMAAHWATGAVHAVPVFGESGALLEHKVFTLFYNVPLTVRRKMNLRARLRSAIAPRYWHIPACSCALAALLALVEYAFLRTAGRFPSLSDVWWAMAPLPLVCGAAVTLAAGGARLPKRFLGGVACGTIAGVLSAAAATVIQYQGGFVASAFAVHFVWRAFIFSLGSAAGVLLTEVMLPDPEQA
jgi:hypothetical protein